MSDRDTWNPGQYERFRHEREQPFFDLLALVTPEPHMRIVDLGCGTGSGTTVLHERLRAAATLGLDRSPRMLEERATAQMPPGLRFVVGTIETFDAVAEYDLVFSNAALHWVEHHEMLIPRLVRALKPRGQLAFQVPAMHDHVSDTIADRLAGIEPYRSELAGWRRPQPVLSPEEYAHLLHRAGLTSLRSMLIVYPHLLPGPADVVEWMRGSLMTDYERRMRPEVFARFFAEYRRRVVAALEPTRPFLYAFKRILCYGRLE